MPQPRKTEYNGADTAPVFYCNSAQILRSNFDFRILVAVIQKADDTEVVSTITAQIYMSPQHAKVFAKLITGQVEAHEQQFGPIAVEPTGTAKEPDAT